MHDPVAAGRHTALRAIGLQAVVAVVLAAAFLVQGPRDALAAVIGGGALVLGHLVVAMVALGAGSCRRGWHSRGCCSASPGSGW